ncbi:MAG: site-specific DNA-methyltransferase [Rhodospirillaceae bacterium]
MAAVGGRPVLRRPLESAQCIYIDPPYGIKFNSNFQWSTTSRDVKDGNRDHVTREPEQVKAFRDTWRDGIHSYLTYLRDRLTVARDLLHESGSVFVQIGDENVHLARSLLDEVFGGENFVSLITVWKTSSQTSSTMAGTSDYLLWYARKISSIKYRELKLRKDPDTPNSGAGDYRFLWLGNDRRKPVKNATKEELETYRVFGPSPTTSQSGSETTRQPVFFKGREFLPGPGGWKTNAQGFCRLISADRIMSRTNSLRYVRFLDDYPVVPLANLWTDVRWGFDASEKNYVVQTNPQVIARCVLMTTDPGDLVLDPTCGSGTTATVAEQWGRRWITLDTSRVALALARARIMGARYPYYLLADSPDGQRKESELTGTVPPERPTHGDIRQGFVYERVPHVTLKSIANNAEIDVIWEKWQETLEPLRAALNAALGESREEWQIPREAGKDWPAKAKGAHGKWWEARIGRQREIDASIAVRADSEYLYDRPYADNSRIRVAGPFTVESLSPHRVVAVDEQDELLDTVDAAEGRRARGDGAGGEADFAETVLEHLRSAGVQQAHREDRIAFTAVTGWPGNYVCAEGRYLEGGDGGKDGTERRAGIFIGPEFGTVARADLVAAAREAADAGFDVLVACAFNFDAHAADFDKLGPVAVLKARMNPDLHMAGELKNTGAGNLFVVFGEPDIEVAEAGAEADGTPLIKVKIAGVDVFRPSTGEIESGGPDSIAVWFIDTDYNEESFFVRHAYFLGAPDPYKALKTTLKAEIDEEAWQSLHSDTSRPFPKPKSGRIAVKVINHLGDEVMKVFRVG